MSRWKAAAIHSTISAAIALLIGLLLFGIWYPPPYFHAGGGDELVLLIGVDLAIGPLLTLIVFRSGKRWLLFDLATIGVLQTIALVYCISVSLRSRPIFLVGEPDRFVLVAANEITDADLAQGHEPRFRLRSWTGPQLVAAVLPTDVGERNDLAFDALAGRDIDNQPKYYRDYAEARASLLKNAKPLGALLAVNPEYGPLIAKATSTSHRDSDDIVWIPLQARKADIVMLLDARSAQPLRALELDPWSGQ